MGAEGGRVAACSPHRSWGHSPRGNWKWSLGAMCVVVCVFECVFVYMCMCVYVYVCACICVVCVFECVCGMCMCV